MDYSISSSFPLFSLILFDLLITNPLGIVNFLLFFKFILFPFFILNFVIFDSIDCGSNSNFVISVACVAVGLEPSFVCSVDQVFCVEARIMFVALRNRAWFGALCSLICGGYMWPSMHDHPCRKCPASSCAKFLSRLHLLINICLSCTAIFFPLCFTSTPAPDFCSGEGSPIFVNRSKEANPDRLHPLKVFNWKYSAFLRLGRFVAMRMNGNCTSVSEVRYKCIRDTAVSGWKKRWFPLEDAESQSFIVFGQKSIPRSYHDIKISNGGRHSSSKFGLSVIWQISRFV